ncbi:anthranilate synthase component II [Gracilibacillus salinarum]|uniref:Aminodeoxychorismate/anthranilate synthase component II n=1 Tax=Gracilibacillus salinarum TaxID=2932255 RepID=A0ABY4GM31_9BACI|nr:aminodeoxychorismate/anthranilate synthase component II [Gracilibacillus salinarum]UOQ85276.1 aminodeoxychorismate/anthranilate synthase component II [Gracilibacillus salinarum]
MIVIIDNYDSFTYNLAQYYRQLTKTVRVVRVNETTIEQLEELQPNLIVISPGPGAPQHQIECLKILEHFYATVPIFGVCLGMQIIAHYFGGSVSRANAPMHGKTSMINHTGTGVFKGIPDQINVTRYHSLVTHQIPEQFAITAHTTTNEIMGIKHRQFKVEGIQFHPEAILTEFGFDIIRNSYIQAMERSK